MPFINFKEIRKNDLDSANSEWNVHDHLKGKNMEELQSISAADRLPWHTMAVNLTGDLNVGTVIRTSHCLGASSVIVVGRTKLDRRSLVGAEKYITVEKYRTVTEQFELKVDEIINILNEKNLTPIFCESGGISLPKIEWKIRFESITRSNRQPCLVMGNETGGIPAGLLELSNFLPNSFTASIPQRGVIRSLNVAVAHSVIASHMCSSMGWL
jgi:tRNA G18 (ribose-2'-O)-methylase SpoU